MVQQIFIFSHFGRNRSKKERVVIPDSLVIINPAVIVAAVIPMTDPPPHVAKTGGGTFDQLSFGVTLAVPGSQK